MTEQELQQYILANLPKNCRMWRSNTGGFVRQGQLIRYGLTKGSSDIIGFTQHEGIAVFTAIEVKSEKGKLSKDQKIFLKIVKDFGGIAEVIRSKEDWDKFCEKY